MSKAKRLIQFVEREITGHTPVCPKCKVDAVKTKDGLICPRCKKEVPVADFRVKREAKVTEQYTLDLTSDDVETIAFVGDRYSWSSILAKYSEGENDIPEHEAWAIKDGFESDAEGGHSFFPMLDPHSELHDKLMSFYDSIV